MAFSAVMKAPVGISHAYGASGNVYIVNAGGFITVTNQADVQALVNQGFILEPQTVNGITATPSGTQANSLALTSASNRVTTVATIGDGVKLPVSQPGVTLIIANAAANACNVFPQLGEMINALAVNTAFSLPGGKMLVAYCINAGQWHMLLSA